MKKVAVVTLCFTLSVFAGTPFVTDAIPIRHRYHNPPVHNVSHIPEFIYILKKTTHTLKSFINLEF